MKFHCRILLKWFCGRKNHRVVSGDQEFYTVPCEAVARKHPLVRKAALVGVGEFGRHVPLMLLELEANVRRWNDFLS